MQNSEEQWRLCNRTNKEVFNECLKKINGIIVFLISGNDLETVEDDYNWWKSKKTRRRCKIK